MSGVVGLSLPAEARPQREWGVQIASNFSAPLPDSYPSPDEVTALEALLVWGGRKEKCQIVSITVRHRAGAAGLMFKMAVRFMHL